MKNTRYLRELRRMIEQDDRDGAIADMLQVLRECGVIERATVEASFAKVTLTLLPGYNEDVKRRLPERLGNVMGKSVSISERDEGDYHIVRAQVWYVKEPR